jgi:hypothetical protein
MLAGLWPAVATAQAAGPANTESFTKSGLIPFYRSQKAPPPFTGAPTVRFRAGGKIHLAAMDTGSVGIALSASQIENYDALLKTKGVSQGWSYLSSSKRLWVGHWVPLTVTFLDNEDRPIASAEVPVLGVEYETRCPDYVSGPTCPDVPRRKAPDTIHYMGVGFGREHDRQPQGTPDKNPFLNITQIGQTQVAPGSMRRGYILSPEGVTVGLTEQNSAGFRLVKLTADPLHPGDWQALPMCISVNQSPCVSGSALIDTGITHMYLTVPDSMHFKTVWRPDPSFRQKLLKVLAPGTVVEVRFPGSENPTQSYQFKVGEQCNPAAPTLAIPSGGKNPVVFVNTGRHFLRSFQFLYDADTGQVGLKKLEPPQAAPGCNE